MPTQIHPWNPQLELCDVKHEIRQEIANIVASVFHGEDIRGMTLPGRICLTEQEVGLAMKATEGSIQFDAIDFNLVPTIPTNFQNSMLTNGKDGKYKRALHTQANAAYTMTGYKGDFFKVQKNIYNDPELGDQHLYRERKLMFHVEHY